MSSLFQSLTSLSLVAIFQHHKRMEFTFHNLFTCVQYNDFLDRAQLRKHDYVAFRLKLLTCCQNATVVMMIWLTVTKYPYLKWQCIFPFYVYFAFLYHCQDFQRTWLYIWVKWQVSHKKQEMLTIYEHLSSSLVLCLCPCCSLFLCCPNMCLYVLSSDFMFCLYS